jgi:hypothetical protein
LSWIIPWSSLYSAAASSSNSFTLQTWSAKPLAIAGDMPGDDASGAAQRPWSSTCGRWPRRGQMRGNQSRRRLRASRILLQRTTLPYAWGTAMTETEPKRRWFRFSIRDLLWLTAVVAISTAWWIDRSKLQHQREAISPHNRGYNVLFEDGRQPNKVLPDNR